MFGFKKAAPEPKVTGKSSFVDRLKAGLAKTRATLTQNWWQTLWGKKQIDAELLETIETQLLLADVGVAATEQIMQRLHEGLSRHELNDGAAVFQALKHQLLSFFPAPAPWPAGDHKPHLILVVGINGSGKTTTIAKLAHYFQSQGKRVLLAAGDTFRAAAIDQLQVWGQRHEVPVIAQQPGADSASVIFDAMQSAQAKGIDVVIADTAGRLHTQSHLMEELKKIARVVKKLDPTAPHDTFLVLDAGTGQNALSQTELFKEAVAVNGLVVTKLDGTAKGGILFSLMKTHAIPIRFIGVGETADDLRPFEPEVFVDALFSQDETA